MEDHSTHPHFDSEEAADGWFSALAVTCPSCDGAIPDGCVCGEEGGDE